MWHIARCLLLVPVLISCVGSFTHTWVPKAVVKHEEISKKILRFEGEKTEPDYFKLLLQENDRLIVGARNKMYNISVIDLEQDELRTLKWPPNSKDNTSCSSMYKDQHKDKCQNFIKVLGKMEGEKYYVCGTNAFSPKCRIYEYKHADYPAQAPGFETTKEFDGVGASPYDPEHNSTAIFTDGKLFSATVADRLSRDPLIMERMKMIRTEQHDSNMLKDPHFVSSYDIDEKIYFFLREDAVENINCGKATFSRVARICKNDEGRSGTSVWTSFFKARLNCSVPGEIPFPFDELQSMSDLSFGNHHPTNDPKQRSRILYGVFNTPANSIEGSAVCAFTLADIEHAFMGQFKAQQTTSHAWVPIPVENNPVPHPAQVCVNKSKELTDNTLTFIRNHPLMDRSVNPAGGKPMLIQTQGLGGRFSAIAVDPQVLASDGFYYDVMFVGTTDGRVLKAVNTGKPGLDSSVVIEDIQVLGQHEAIREIKVLRKHGHNQHEKLIIVSKDNIVSMPLHRCGHYKTCSACLRLQDPYCAWLDTCTTHTTRGLQDIRNGDASQCRDGSYKIEKEGPIMEIDVVIPTTPKPVEVSTCQPCTCNCSQSDVIITMESTQNNHSGQGRTKSGETDTGPVVLIPEPCENPRTDDQIYTASTLAVACVVAIVVAAMIGFFIGYRVSLCRNHTRNTETMINFEQHFGSLRKNGSRHSGDTSNNIFQEPTKNTAKMLTVNNLSAKSPNLPNGSLESRTITPQQASRTYI